MAVHILDTARGVKWVTTATLMILSGNWHEPKDAPGNGKQRREENQQDERPAKLS